MDDAYRIHSATKVTLSPAAKDWAVEFGLTLEEMAKHILSQERLRDSGMTQRNGEN
jgi:hypothetical protein